MLGLFLPKEAWQLMQVDVGGKVMSLPPPGFVWQKEHCKPKAK